MSPIRLTVARIAEALGARVEGDGSLELTGLSEPGQAGPEHLALAMNPKYAEGLARGQARAAVLWEGADWRALGLEAAIFVPRPRYAMAGVTRAFDPGPDIAPGIHPTAVVDPGAVIGEGAAIGPLVVIGRGVRIGAHARIAPLVSIAESAEIGDDALILSGVRIGARVRIGSRFIAHPGTVIGSDGFSFVTPEKSAVEEVRESLGQRQSAAPQAWVRIHSLGSVVIGDDVEIGAGTCIDRGTIRDTKIGSGCKLDNLCHIAHNVVMGRDCVMAAQSGIAGSTRTGDRLVMGGQSGIADNLVIGSDVILGAATKVLSNVATGRAMMGYPAVEMQAHVEIYKGTRRLRRLFDQVAELRETVTRLGQKTGNGGPKP